MTDLRVQVAKCVLCTEQAYDYPILIIFCIDINNKCIGSKHMDNVKIIKY